MDNQKDYDEDYNDEFINENELVQFQKNLLSDENIQIPDEPYIHEIPLVELDKQ